MKSPQSDLKLKTDLDNHVLETQTKNITTPLSKLTPAQSTQQAKIDEKKVEKDCFKMFYAKYSEPSDFVIRHEAQFCNIIGSWLVKLDLKNKNCDPNNKFNKFYKALYLSDLVYSFEKVPINYKKSLQLLDEVIHEDPSNAAPLFYKFYIQEKMGLRTDPELIKSLLDQDKNWNTYAVDINKSILNLVETPQDYLQSTMLIGGLPRASLNEEVRDFIKSKNLGSLADKMIEKNPIPVNDNLMYNMSTDLVELAVGLKIKKDLGSPRTDYPTRDDFEKYKDRANTAGTSYFENFKICDQKKIDDFLRDEIHKMKPFIQ